MSGSDVIVHISGHQASWLQDAQFASIASCQAKSFTYGSALDASGGPEVIIVDQPKLNEL